MVEDPTCSRWDLVWSGDGEAVALRRDGVIVALVRSAERRGRSSAIATECPWGAPLTVADLVAVGLA